MTSIDTLLNEAKIDKVDIFGVTCVDPKYPAKTLGPEFDIGVHYTEGSHPLGGHVQMAPPNTTQLFLKYLAPGSFEKIRQEEVHANLGNGVIQLAYRDGVAIMGIPGDVLALDPHGPGFAFGQPGKAPGAEAQKVYLEMLTRGPPMLTRIMGHHDCGAVAHSLGHEFPGAHGVDEHNFMGSPYQLKEIGVKYDAAARVVHETHSLGHARPHLIVPSYESRVPGIHKRLNGSH